MSPTGGNTWEAALADLRQQLEELVQPPSRFDGNGHRYADDIVECKPWCRLGNGHPELLADDQWCYAEGVTVDATLAGPKTETVGGQRFVHFPQTAQVYAAYSHHTPRAEVCLSVNGGPDLVLTAGEARRLAAGLDLAADQVEQDLPAH